jgi:hypothetical protein
VPQTGILPQPGRSSKPQVSTAKMSSGAVHATAQPVIMPRRQPSPWPFPCYVRATKPDIWGQRAP